MNKVIKWLPENIPKQSAVSVVHGDFRVDNLIFDKDDSSVVKAVLDWELSTLGKKNKVDSLYHEASLLVRVQCIVNEKTHNKVNCLKLDLIL